MKTIQLKVDGMTCGSCVSSVTRALQQVPGVRTAEVDLSTGVAQVQTTDGATLEVQDLAKALAAVGYDAKALSSSAQRAAPGACGHSDATPKGCCCGH